MDTYAGEAVTKEVLDSKPGRLLVASGCCKAWKDCSPEGNTYAISFRDPVTYFFGIFDGHGSDAVSSYAHEHLMDTILQHPDYTVNANIANALKMSFLDIDYRMMMQNVGADVPLSGTAAVLIIIQGDTLYCANVGNTKAIASIGGHLQLLSMDPEIERDSESEASDHNPILYRMLGDFELKSANRNPVSGELFTAMPSVERFHINHNWEFMLLACDGVWSTMSDMEVLRFCRQHIAKNMQPMDIITELFNYLLTRYGNKPHLTGDVTVIIICLLQGRPYSQLAVRCRFPGA
ncbi:probable protein phosphatase 2C T23F11.1 [Drosophila nasuta]|uniref:protein-serine/threonine phosphatase n=1 Tax=Drosophila albomicans TaxID=7291 RepID=A0A9C6SRS5_DROAB|nr:probable protein phosphatase 2C T23F11.1 [Drosophila albomicans]XP_060661581.1 probable protein phosphatase 2C T23F11.1 [Drosophila nasuta]